MIVTSPTLLTVVSRSTTARSARSVKSSADNRSLVSEIRNTGWLSLSALTTRGSSASSGSRLATEPTASRTSAAAASMSRSVVKVIRVWPPPSREVDSIRRTPSIRATAPSITSVISVSMMAAAAPV